MTMIALISTAASKEPHCHNTKFGKENICLYIILYVILYKDNFFPNGNKNGLQPGSSEQGVLLLSRPRSSGDFLSLPNSRNRNDF